MCYRCVANNRGIRFTQVIASQADVVKATEFLHQLGFSGIKFDKHPKDNWVRFKFTDWNKYILQDNFGKPKQLATRLQYEVKGLGFILVNETGKRVSIRNVERVSKKRVTNPLSKQEIPPYNPNIVNKDLANESIEDQYKRAQAQGKQFYIHFMKKAWTYFNREKFQSQMEMPNIRLLRDTGPSLRRRGHWAARKRELAISPRLFNAQFSVFNEIFLHEMCHQAVSEIDKVVDRTEQGHGPNWKAWMRKVGLEPNRYDKTDVVEYMTEDERQTHVQNKSKREEENGKRSRLPTYNLGPTQYIPCDYVRVTGDVEPGFLFGDKNHRGANFISDQQLRTGLQTGKWKWYILKKPKIIPMYFFSRLSPVEHSTQEMIDKFIGFFR